MATTETTLIEMIMNLLRNPSDLAAFKANPDAYLQSCGAGDVSAADLHDALVLSQDDDDFSRHTNSGAHIPPPPHPEPGESDHEAAVRYLNTYVTNNIDDRDTNVDNSVNQHIDTGGGDFDQDIDTRSNVVSGDHAVGAGDDISDSTITSGDDNQVGDGNVRGDGNVQGEGNAVVHGDDNNTAFGAGDATSSEFDHTTVDDGGALSVGGSASGDNYDSDSHNTIDTTTTTDVRDDHSLSYDTETTSGSHNDTDTQTSTDSHEQTTLHSGSDNTTEIHTT